MSRYLLKDYNDDHARHLILRFRREGEEVGGEGGGGWAGGAARKFRGLLNVRASGSLPFKHRKTCNVTVLNVIGSGSSVTGYRMSVARRLRLCKCCRGSDENAQGERKFVVFFLFFFFFSLP